MPFPDHVLPSRMTFDRYPKWGDVYWFDFGRPKSNQATIAEPHMGVVVSNSDVILRGTVLIIPISGAEHRRNGYTIHIVVAKKECPRTLDKDSIVKVDQIYCVNYKKELPDDI